MKLVRIGGHPNKYAGQLSLSHLLSELDKNINVETIDPKESSVKLFERLIRLKDHLLLPLLPFNDGDVFLTDDTGFVIVSLLKRVKKVPVIYIWYDDFIDVLENRPNLWNPTPWNLFQYLRYQNYQNANVLLVGSDETLRSATILRGSSEGIFYMPVCVDTSRFDPELYDGQAVRKKFGLTEKDIIVGYAGRICGTADNFAGKPLVLSAARILDARHDKKIKFLVVGWGPKMNFFKKFVQKEGLENNFLFAGYVPDVEYPNYIAAFDIAVAPLDDIHVSYTRSETKVKEYLSMGKAIVATGIGENIKDLDNGRAGLLSSPDNKDMGDCVLHLIDSEKLRRELGKNARKRAVGIYDGTVLAKQVETVIEYAIESSRKRY